MIPIAEPGTPLRVAIVGLGPKGLFALERLLDHARALGTGRIDVDVFEPHPVPGAGPVYDPGQPSYLRMNLAADGVDLWWPGSRAATPTQRQSFVEWRATRGGGDDAYPPRAEVGRYLAAGFETLLRNAPPNVSVDLHSDAVHAVHANGERWDVHAGAASRAYDEVLVAVGHQPSDPPAGVRPRHAGSDPTYRTARESGLVPWTHAAPLVPAVFPVGRWLDRDAVPPGATVAVRGFALTFIDAALALTEGRGGSFVPLDHPWRLRYVAGADEVGALVPFTRTGRPLLAKPAPALAAGIPMLEQVAQRGRARLASLEGPLDLRRDIVPILADTAAASLRAAASATPAAEAADAVSPVWQIERSLDVGAGLARPHRAWALGHTWRTLYPAIVAILGGDGLPDGEWPEFLRLAAEMERIAFGPPPVNAAKLLALIEAGRVDLTHVRGGTLADRDGRTHLDSSAGSHAVDVVVEAVLPGPGAVGHAGLLAGLLAEGHASVAPGRRGLDVEADGTCRNRDGAPSSGLAAIGRPTEDSVIGNDTLNRALHPQPDRWARRVASRAGAHAAPPLGVRPRQAGSDPMCGPARRHEPAPA